MRWWWPQRRRQTCRRVSPSTCSPMQRLWTGTSKRAPVLRCRTRFESNISPDSPNSASCQVRILRYYVQLGPNERQERNVGAVVSPGQVVEHKYSWSDESWLPRRQRIKWGLIWEWGMIFLSAGLLWTVSSKLTRSCWSSWGKNFFGRPFWSSTTSPILKHTSHGPMEGREGKGWPRSKLVR